MSRQSIAGRASAILAALATVGMAAPARVARPVSRSRHRAAHIPRSTVKSAFTGFPRRDPRPAIAPTIERCPYRIRVGCRCAECGGELAPAFFAQDPATDPPSCTFMLGCLDCHAQRPLSDIRTVPVRLKMGQIVLPEGDQEARKELRLLASSLGISTVGAAS